MAADRRALSRIAGWLALGYFLAFAGFLLWNVVPEGEADVFLLSLFTIPWMASPVVISAVLAGASPTRLGAAIFLLLELGLILSVVLIIVDYVYIHPSSTAGIGLLFWPLVQLVAILGVVCIAALFGWRMRSDFLKDETERPSPPGA